MMNKMDAVEQAYKNGYEAGKKYASEKFAVRAKERLEQDCPMLYQDYGDMQADFGYEIVRAKQIIDEVCNEIVWG